MHSSTVEQALHSIFDAQNTTDFPLYRMMKYQLGWLDETGSPETFSPPSRFYGVLCMQNCGESPHTISGPVSAAMELLYQSISVHEDMQKGTPDTGVRPAVWWHWGPAQAINVGDGLHALGRLAILNLENQGLPANDLLSTIRILDSTALTFYEGQYLELSFQDRITLSQSQYIKSNELKIGALFGGALALGANISGKDSGIVNAFKKFGELVGLAVQIQNDMEQLRDAKTNSMYSSRLANKIKLFPIVCALEVGNIKQKRRLGEIYSKRFLEPNDIGDIQAILQETGAEDLSAKVVSRTIESAIGVLKNAGALENDQVNWECITKGFFPNSMENGF